MRVAILYNEASQDATIEERDVLVQRTAVAEALGRLGHDPISLPCTLDLAAVQSQLVDLRPAVVFNLVESLGGTDRLMALAPMVLEAMGIPYTGSPSSTLLATSNKLAAKQSLLTAGLPTPAWHRGGGVTSAELAPGARMAPGQRVILKTVWEHASFALDDSALLECASEGELDERLWSREFETGRPWYAEQFIDGREFNLSLLAGAAAEGAGAGTRSPCSLEVLPPAEIDFSAFAPTRPRIVGYRAKWDAHSFEYHHTPRHFEFAESDRPLLEELRDLARKVWRTFQLRGYARVDFRVDAEGRPWILEANANPCLSPDAGFAAALGQAGIEYDQAIERIVAQTLRQPESKARHKGIT